MRRALLINAVLFIGFGVVLLVTAFTETIDWAIIVTVSLAAGIAIPLQFNKSLPPDVARDLSRGKIIAVYGWRYWCILAFAFICSLVGILLISAFFTLSNLGSFGTGMGVMSIMMAFVNPRYEKVDGPNSFG